MKKIFSFFALILGLTVQSVGQSDSTAINNIIGEWTRAHNEHNPTLLSKLYASKVLFYCQELSNQECVRIKAAALNKMPSYRQSVVSKIEVTYYDSGILKCDFTKEVSANGVTKDYASYLLLKSENGSYSIVGESDNITDANLNYHLNIGNPIDLANNANTHTKTTIIYAVLIVFSVLILIGVLYFLKRKSNTKQPQQNSAKVSAPEIQVNDTGEVATETLTLLQTGSNIIKNIDLNEGGKRTKEYLGNAFTQTRTAITKFFDLIDSIVENIMKLTHLLSCKLTQA